MKSGTQNLLPAEDASLPPRRREGASGVAERNQPPTEPAQRALAQQDVEREPLLESRGKVQARNWAKRQDWERPHEPKRLPPQLLHAPGLQEGPHVRLVLTHRQPFAGSLCCWPIWDGPRIKEGQRKLCPSAAS
eukprot:3375307-Pyramimonas_sp.AAC.1